MIERTSTKFVNQATDLIRCYKIANSRLYEIALGLVRLDRLASGIVNADHSIMRAAVMLRVSGCVAKATSSHVEASPHATGIYLITICETFVTRISGLPWDKVIFPDTATILPSYCCGLEKSPALAAGIKAVTI